MKQREIKFRAWDVDSSVMYLPSAMSPALTIAPECDDNSLIYLLYWSPDGDMKTAEIEVIKNGVALEYICRKDMNGAEIYEGDIIYLAGYGIYEVAYPYLELWEADSEGDIGAILGNIYENPELLAGEKL